MLRSLTAWINKLEAKQASLLIFIISAALLLIRLGDPPAGYQHPGDPPTYVLDECYQAFTAGRYAAGDIRAFDAGDREDAARFATADITEHTVYDWVHPPGAKLVMAFFAHNLGPSPGVFRLGSVLFGLLTMMATWLLANRLGGARFGLIAIALLMSDGLFFTMSRLAMIDIYVTGAVVWAAYAMLRFWEAAEHREAWLIATGTACGIAIAMKWSAAPLALACAMLALLRVRAVLYGKPPEEQNRLFTIWDLAFIVFPLAIYLAVYIPYFLAGHTLNNFIDMQANILSFHHNLKATHEYASPWWSWPLIIRPLWLFHYYGPEPETVRTMYAMGNPLLWWSFLPALVWIAVRFLRYRLPGDAAILLGFLSLWLPWAFVSRITYIYYLLPAVPFGILAVTRALFDISQIIKLPQSTFLGVAIAICLLVFMHFYPIWSAWPITPEAHASHRWFWFDSWR